MKLLPLRAACLAAAVAASAPAAAITVEVVWTAPRCDYLLVRDSEGHGIVYRSSPIEIAVGDRLEGGLDQVNTFRRVVKVSTGEATMMRTMKYGIRRKQAVETIQDWSAYCDPPLD